MNQLNEKKYYFKRANDHIGFWTMWLAMFTAFLSGGTVIAVILGLVQLNTISETSKADFILKFKESFFKKEARELMDIIDKDSLKFVLSKDSVAHFEYKTNDSVSVISAYEVEETLLDQFDDIGLFERHGIIDIEMVYFLFDWYIEECWKNKEIQKYILYERENYGTDIYRNFDYIYFKCRNQFLNNNDTTKIKKH